MERGGRSQLKDESYSLIRVKRLQNEDKVARIYELKISVEINTKILELAHELQSTPSIQASNLGACWHSGTNVLSDPRMKEVRQVIARAVRTVEMEDAMVHNDRIIALDEYGPIESWINITYHGGSNLLHNHAGAFWSGVYYAKTTPPNNGAITFDLAAAHGHLFTMHELNRFAAYRNDQLSITHKISPEPGLLLIFPSWLPHRVEALSYVPKASDAAYCEDQDPSLTAFLPRVSLAFNFYRMLSPSVSPWPYDSYFAS